MLGAVPQEQAATLQHQNVPQWEGCHRALQLLTSYSEAVGGEFRVESWGNTCSSRCAAQWWPMPPAWGQFGGFTTCQVHIHTPASCFSLMSYSRGAPSSVMMLGSWIHCTHRLHSLRGFRREWTSSDVKNNPANPIWVSLTRKLTLINTHSRFMCHSTNRASAPHETQKLGGGSSLLKRLNTAGFLSPHTGCKTLLISPWCS